MSRRSDPYPAPGYGVRVPEPIWSAALNELRVYGTLGRDGRGSEGLVYLGGAVAGDEMIVTSLYCLDHAPQGGRVIVTPIEAKWLLRVLRAHDEKLVGQVHSHRGTAGHSRGDDQHATSFHEGFLSIVVPQYGHGITAVSHCAVLEYRDGAFADLTASEVQRRVRVEPYVVRRITAAPATDPPESRWHRYVQRLRSTVLGLR